MSWAVDVAAINPPPGNSSRHRLRYQERLSNQQADAIRLHCQRISNDIVAGPAADIPGIGDADHENNDGFADEIADGFADGIANGIDGSDNGIDRLGPRAVPPPELRSSSTRRLQGRPGADERGYGPVG